MTTDCHCCRTTVTRTVIILTKTWNISPIWGLLTFLLISKTIGQALNKIVYNDTCALKGVFKDINTIISSNCDSYLDDPPAVLVEFLCELTGVTLQNTGRKTYSLCLQLVRNE